MHLPVALRVITMAKFCGKCYSKKSTVNLSQLKLSPFNLQNNVVVTSQVLLGVETLLDVAEILFGVDVVLVNDRAAIHTDKLMTILEGKALNTASMAIFSTCTLTVDPYCAYAAPSRGCKISHGE